MNIPWPLLLVVLCHLGFTHGDETKVAATNDDVTANIFEDVLVLQGQLYDVMRSESRAMEELKNITTELTQLQKEFNDTDIRRCNADESDEKYNERWEEIQNEMTEENQKLDDARIERQSLRIQMANITQQTDARIAEKERLTTLANELAEKKHQLESEMEDAEMEYHHSPERNIEEQMEDAINAYNEHCQNETVARDSINRIEEEMRDLSHAMDELEVKEHDLDRRIRTGQHHLHMLRREEVVLEREREEAISQQCEKIKEELEKKIRNSEKERREAKGVVTLREAERKWFERQVRQKMEELNEMMEKGEKEEEEEGNGGRKELE